MENTYKTEIATQEKLARTLANTLIDDTMVTIQDLESALNVMYSIIGYEIAENLPLRLAATLALRAKRQIQN